MYLSSFSCSRCIQWNCSVPISLLSINLFLTTILLEIHLTTPVKQQQAQLSCCEGKRLQRGSWMSADCTAKEANLAVLTYDGIHQLNRNDTKTREVDDFLFILSAAHPQWFCQNKSFPILTLQGQTERHSFQVCCTSHSSLGSLSSCSLMISFHWFSEIEYN